MGQTDVYEAFAGKTPHELYNAILDMVARTHYFPQMLGEWQRFALPASAVPTYSAALRAARRALASIGDKYTRIEDPSPDMGSPSANVRYQMLSDCVGYISIATFSDHDLPKAFQTAVQKLPNARAFVIDLTNNLGGFTNECRQLMSSCLDTGVLAIARQRLPLSGESEIVNVLTPDHIDWTVRALESGAQISEKLERMPNCIKGRPVVILVNRNTASASELFAETLRHHGVAHIIGQVTKGKGIGQSFYSLPEGYLLVVTDTLICPPSGKWAGDAGIIHGAHLQHGMTPDEMVTIRSKSIRASLEYLERILGPAVWNGFQPPAPSPSGGSSLLVLGLALGAGLLIGSALNKRAA